MEDCRTIKDRVFVWEVFWGGLNTLDRVKKRIDIWSSPLRPMYRRPLGPTQHFFMNCQMASNPGISCCRLSAIIGLFLVLFVNLYYNRLLATIKSWICLTNGEHVRCQRDKKPIWLERNLGSGFQAVMWVNWLERNQRIFCEVGYWRNNLEKYVEATMFWLL